MTKHLKLPLLVALVTVAVLALGVLLITLHLRRVAHGSAAQNGYVFSEGALWASIGGKDRLALIDSGTSMSIFPKDWKSQGEATGAFTAVTPLGRQQLQVREIGPVDVGGSTFQGKAMVANVAYPIIGDDFIFSRKNVLFTHDGLRFDVTYKRDDALACAGTVVDLTGNTLDSPIASISFLLTIDGQEQKVFFDTGRTPALEATASAPGVHGGWFAKVDVVRDAFGQWQFARYRTATASLSLGGKTRTFEYRRYFNDHSVAAPFVMGADILEDYSILIDDHVACFFDARYDAFGKAAPAAPAPPPE